MVTIGASLRGVSRRHSHERNAMHLTLVSDKRAKLIERPSTTQSSLRPSNFLFCTLSYVRKILNGYALVLIFRLHYNSLTQRVVNKCRCISLSASQTFQELLGSFRTFALKRCANLIPLNPIFVYFFRRHFFSGRQHSNVNHAHIYTKKFIHVLNLVLRKLHSLKDMKLSFLINQICLTLNIRQPIRPMTHERNSFPFFKRGDRNIIQFVRQYSRIISYRASEFKFTLCFFVQLIGIGNFADRPNNQLRRKQKAFTHTIINYVVKLNLVESLLFKSLLRNIIARAIESLDSLEQRLFLIRVGQQFNFECQLHK